MSVLQIVLVFGVIPAGFIAAVALLIFAPSAARAPRYRPGRPWPHDPVWYVPHPLAETPTAERRALGAAERTRELPAVQPPASVLDEAPTARGGAHGSW